MEIRTICGNTAYLDTQQLIGLYQTDPQHCILLDCGPAALRNEIEETLARAGLTPIGILATHAHFDHFGNATWFQQKYGIPVAITFGEAELCRTFPAIKSHLFVYSAGEIMTDPMLMNLPCKVDRVIMPDEEDIVFCGVSFKILRTPGHSPEHASIITPDGVCYCGDALLCGQNLERAKLPYTYNFRQSLESIELFRNIPCNHMLVAHKGVIEAPFDELLNANRRCMETQLRVVSSLIDHQMSLEEIFTAVRDTMHIRVNTPQKAESLERFIRPYLECLLDDGTHKLSLRGTGTLCYEPV